LTPEDGTDMSQNVSNKLPSYAVLDPRRTQIAFELLVAVYQMTKYFIPDHNHTIRFERWTPKMWREFHKYTTSYVCVMCVGIC